MVDLKPCPFCGGSVLLRKSHTTERSDSIEHLTTPNECGLDDFSNFNYDTPVEVLWNARAAMKETPSTCIDCDMMDYPCPKHHPASRHD